MQIIFCDNHLLVVFKPAGICTQPHLGHTRDLTTQAKGWVKERYAKKGAVFLEPIHRLDTPVSGLVVFARTSKALERLQKAMREGCIQKTYFAWVEGHLEEKTGTLEHYLVHGEHRANVVQKTHAGAKKAVLHYTVLHEDKESCLLSIHLETGRYHQIRAQLSAIGHPVIGDTKYASNYKNCVILLHHATIQFPHPIGGKRVTFSSPCKSPFPFPKEPKTPLLNSSS